jgi:hypothetical protein
MSHKKFMLIGGLIILALLATTQTQQFEKDTIAHFPSINQCQQQYSFYTDRGDGCALQSVNTPELTSCILSCGNDWSSDVCMVFTQGSDTCSQVNEWSSGNQCWYNCMVTAQPGCNSDADTNCDLGVTDTELLNYAVLWLNNQLSDSQLLSAANGWLIT